MKSQYYISPEDFFKMIDSGDKTPILHIIEKDGSRTPVQSKRKITTVVPSSIRVSEGKDKYISPEDFFRMVDSGYSSVEKKVISPIKSNTSKTGQTAQTGIPKQQTSKTIPGSSGRLVLLPRSIPADKKLMAPKSEALTKKTPSTSHLYDIKREGKIITIKKKETEKEKKDKKKLAKKIERSTKKQIRAEEKQMKKKAKAEEKKARKLEKYRTIGKDKRYTEPKKRSLLGRIRLQRRLARDYYYDLEEDYETGYITRDDVEESKNAKKRRDRKLYKEVQEYEDAMDDITARKGWNAFKIGLATTALAGAIALSAVTYHQVNKILDSFVPANQIVSIYEMSPEEKEAFNQKMLEIKKDIIAQDGYHFDNLSEEQFADGYSRIMNYEGRLYENALKGAMLGDKDQSLLDSIVERAFGETEATFTDEQRRDYRQLAFELLPYSQPELFGDGVHLIRNPIVIDELNARDNAQMKGYRITLRVNGDEKETVRNLGNIMHILGQMQASDYRAFASMENGQQAFFENILKDVMGEGYESLDKTKMRDYQQIIYEWLSSTGKQYIKDPITLERQIENSNDMEIGG